MRSRIPTVLGLLCGLSASAPAQEPAAYRPDRSRDLGFPIYTNAPAGRQLSGAHAPAATPALAPEETRKLIQVPPGFEVRLFASEPMVVNPVAMTWDERGRLWVVELYEYPKGAAKGEKPRDRIKILEDTDADGVADKVTVFADGFNLATGLALGHGGVYLGVAPNLLFLEDTNAPAGAGAGAFVKANKTTVLKTGFGLEDRHELLNGFAWGPDGWLYMTHGVFTRSKVRDAHDPDGFGVQMDAALARFHPRTKKFEVFADGTSNPWGVDWNERGDAFVSACVIQHLFHMAPGGQYNRQGGTWANPYGYVGDLPTKGLPAIVDWRHYRAAHAGICIYQGDQYPPEWRGLVMLGNIHQNAINCDRLTPVGATYKAEKESKLLGPSKGDHAVGAGNFLVSGDSWFRPVSVQTGPDGALWVMDWCDKYPCYQNANADPEGVDREMGRIWRVVWVGNEKGKKVASRPEVKMDLAKLDDEKLVRTLSQSNIWERRIAQRLITEKVKPGGWLGGDVHSNADMMTIMSGSLAHRMLELVRTSTGEEARLSAHWALFSTEHYDGARIDRAQESSSSIVRAWSGRALGQRRNPVFDRDRIAVLSKDRDPVVRAAVATALRHFTSGSLTVDTLPPKFFYEPDLLPHFRELLARPSVDGDSYYPHIVWMAMEPRVAADPQPFFPLLAANDNSVSAYCTRRTMRRICDLTDAAARAKHLNAAMEFLATLAAKPAVADAALDGLIDSFKAKGAPPTLDLAPIFAKLTAVPALADKARRLATLLGDTSAARVLITKINDAKATVDERLKGIQAAREAKTDAAREELVKLVKTPLTRTSGTLSPSEGERDGVRGSAGELQQQLNSEAIRALGVFTVDQTAYDLVDAWKNFSASTRRAAAEVLVTRRNWARALLAGVEKKQVSPADISATARRALARTEDSAVRDASDRLLGRYRATGDDKLKLIAVKRAVVLAAEPDLKAGHEAAKKACLVCHKLHGEGTDIGPDLTGVGRSTLDALLHNIIDPNEVIGAGYETTEIELKDDRVLSGRIVEESPTRIRLVAAGPTEHIISPSDIALKDGKPKRRTLDVSLMPEGLENMSDADFRNLVWFILNPPADNRPWTPALRRELLGDEKAGAKK